MSRRDRARAASPPALVLPDAIATDENRAADVDPTPVEPPLFAPDAPPVPSVYRVVGPANVAVGGKVYGPGKIVRLSPVEAESLAPHVTPIA